ncbi:MAG TPA: ABC-2 family transporter protein [Anaerolineae bacterium]|jgi:ABC-2 type transport system permease protein|nr:ABC-2 family transporter protein [Anaerolineae bacterium]
MKTSNYTRLLSIFYKNTLMGEMEYRLNFWANLALSLFWLVWAALSVRVYFFHADSIAGWTYHELLVVMGLFFALNGYRQMVLEPNLSRMSEYVRLGTLDYILTKPVNSQFLVSLRHLGVFNWGDPILGLGLVMYAFWKLEYLPGMGELALFALLMLAAMVLLYSVTLILQTTTIWLVNVDRVDAVIMAVVEAGRFPVGFYRGWVRVILTTIVPVAFLTTFPARALLGELEWWIAVIAVVLAAALFVAAAIFWRFALRHYAGASA